MNVLKVFGKKKKSKELSQNDKSKTEEKVDHLKNFIIAPGDVEVTSVKWSIEPGKVKVYEGQLRKTTKVCVKKEEEGESVSFDELLNEAKVYALLCSSSPPTLSSPSSPHIHLLDFWGYCLPTPQKSIWIVTQPQKTTLKQFMQDSVLLKEGEVVQVKDNQVGLTIFDYFILLEGVASALCFLASHSIIHNDIQPSSIIVDEQKTQEGGQDLVTYSTKLGSLSNACKVGGKPMRVPGVAFSPPESLASLNNLSSKADVWAAGVLLWQLFAGVEPFHGNKEDQIKQKVMYLQKTLDRPEGCPEEVYKLIKSCWIYAVDERISAEQLVSKLDMLKFGFSQNRRPNCPKPANSFA